VARFSTPNLATAVEILSRYPRLKSATIPLLHLAQEQDGYVTDDAMEHIAELTGTTPAQVLGTCSFYEMFKREPVGTYLVNVCTNISCQIMGGEELLHHAEKTLGIKAGSTTADGMFTIEDVECIAACTEAPCLQVNYRYRHRISNDEFDILIADLRGGRLSDEIPAHGTLARVRQHIPADKAAGNADPGGVTEPVWLAVTAKESPAPADAAPTAPSKSEPAAESKPSPAPAPPAAKKAAGKKAPAKKAAAKKAPTKPAAPEGEES
jgi:NADH-quinone oxidoreductase subunit E